MSTQSVVEARAILAQAEAAAKEERRQKLITQLATVRAELRTKSAELEKMSLRILQGQSNLNVARGQILAITDALGMLEEQKPAVANFLPDDPEVREWSQKRSALQVELNRLRTARIALPNVELMRIDGVNLSKRVQELMFAESSILNELDGSLAQWPVGGTFGLT